MKPSAQLARSLAGAVLDQVERDQCLNSDRLTEALLARMLVTEAMPDQASPSAPAPATPPMAACARTLVIEMKNWVGANQGNGVPYSIIRAGQDLERTLQREGWL